jgi:hypothetical protein
MAYNKLAPEFDSDSSRLRIHFHRFMDRVLMRGGMQLDETWRKNQELAISSSSSSFGDKVLFTAPMGRSLMPVLNRNIIIIDPNDPVVLEVLAELGSEDIIEMDTMTCELAQAEPSRKMFVTDIGSYALTEMLIASNRLSESTTPLYLIGLGPNKAWMLGQRIGEYAVYNAFTIDYASRSGIELKYSPLMNGGGNSMADYLGVATDQMNIQEPSFFRPLFVNFATSLPGADESIIEQSLSDPYMLGYLENTNIYLSSIGQNLKRMIVEYKYLKNRGKDSEGYLLNILDKQIAASVDFLKNTALAGDKISDYLKPDINRSGKPLNYTYSVEDADMFGMLSILDGLGEYHDISTPEGKSEIVALIGDILKKLDSMFYDVNLGRYTNSVTDKDISIANIYYLNHIAASFKAKGITTGLDEKIDNTVKPALKIMGISEKIDVPKSLKGKAGKVGSVVDVNTDISAAFAMLRLMIDRYNTVPDETLKAQIYNLWVYLLEKSDINRLKVFPGEEVNERKGEDAIRYKYNSYDVGMVTGGIIDILPMLNGREKAIVEIPQMQYLGYGNTKTVNYINRYLPGLRTEVSLVFDDKLKDEYGVYPGDTVKYKIKIMNNCRTTIANDDLHQGSDFNMIEVLDYLPPRFAYVDGSTYVNGEKGPEPEGENHLRWFFKDKGDEGMLVITFLAKVDLTAVEGTYINYAKWGFVNGDYGQGYTPPTGWVESPIDVLESGKLKIKFFEDRNGNGIMDEGEEEKLIPKYEVILDSDIRIYSDRTGEFQPYLVEPGRHSLFFTNLNPVSEWWISMSNPVQFVLKIEEDMVIEVPLVYKKVQKGHVYVDLDGNGTYSNAEEGLINVVLFTGSGQKIISGEGGYFYYYQDYPGDGISIAPKQEFTKIEGKPEISLE